MVEWFLTPVPKNRKWGFSSLVITNGFQYWGLHCLSDKLFGSRANCSTSFSNYFPQAHVNFLYVVSQNNFERSLHGKRLRFDLRFYSAVQCEQHQRQWYPFVGDVAKKITRPNGFQVAETKALTITFLTTIIKHDTTAFLHILRNAVES